MPSYEMVIRELSCTWRIKPDSTLNGMCDWNSGDRTSLNRIKQKFDYWWEMYDGFFKGFCMRYHHLVTIGTKFTIISEPHWFLKIPRKSSCLPIFDHNYFLHNEIQTSKSMQYHKNWVLLLQQHYSGRSKICQRILQIIYLELE